MTDDRTELDGLLAALCDGALSDADHARLERLLDAPDARRRYLETVDLHARLLTRPRAEAGPLAVPARQSAAGPRDRHWHRYLIGAAAAVGVTVGVQALIPRPAMAPVVADATPKVDPHRYVATLARADGCEWDGPGPAIGARIAPGDLRLKRGAARVVFDSGAALVLEAGSAVRVESRSAAAVLAGKVVFRGDDNPEPFDLRTPRATLQDFGTEYAVSVGPDGAEEVHVFDGEVRRVAPGAGSAEVQMNAGQALRFAAADPAGPGAATALDPGRFVRTVPPSPAQADPRDGLLAYDGFDYPADAGADFERAAGGSGWVGPWRKALARPKDPARTPDRVFAPDRGLTRSGASVPAAGGSFDFTGFAKAYRRLAAPLRMDADGVRYLSFLVRREGPQADPLNAVAVLFRTTGELEHDLRTGEADPAQRFNVGVDKGNDVYTHLNRIGTRGPLPLSYGQTYLIAAKIVTGKVLPDQAFVRVYGPDEAVDWDEPTAWSLVGPQVQSDLAFDWLQVHINSRSRQSLDEVRLGATWAAVAHPWVDARGPGR